MNTTTAQARRIERDDDRRRSEILARRAKVRTPEYVGMKARLDAADAADAALRAAEERRRMFASIERLAASVSPRALDRHMKKVEEMIEDAVADHPQVGEDDIAYEMTTNYVRLLNPTKHNLGIAAEILRCQFAMTVEETIDVLSR